MSDRTCGDCTLCCKLMGVSAINKPVNKWCQYCEIGIGCKIYPERPEPCKEFDCMWLVSVGLPEFMKPSKSHVVLIASTTGIPALCAKVDPSYPAAWKQRDVLKVLSILSQSLPVVVSLRDLAYRIVPGNDWIQIPSSYVQKLPDGSVSFLKGAFS